ncbi:hypothetical protein C1X65_10425 [Pseudomonas sp. FW305-70]|nr:hypothetical protein C1X65_10425 [Pseudomonas sp. FW305-70]
MSRWCEAFRLYTKPVGAGLLAKAECQSTSLSTGSPPSRASPLPQGYLLNQINQALLAFR